MAKTPHQYVIVGVAYGGNNYGSHYEREKPVGIQYAVSEAQALSRWIWKYGNRSFEEDIDPVDGWYRGAYYKAVDINDWVRENGCYPKI